jgi:hypothetical protein
MVGGEIFSMQAWIYDFGRKVGVKVIRSGVRSCGERVKEGNEIKLAFVPKVPKIMMGNLHVKLGKFLMNDRVGERYVRESGK